MKLGVWKGRLQNTTITKHRGGWEAKNRRGGRRRPILHSAAFSTQTPKKEEYYMGIETSCDDTAIAIVGTNKTIVTNCVSSQFKLHSGYGGIVPHLAQRAHKENFPIVYQKAIEEWANFKKQNETAKLKAIGVTIGPGLSPCLWVGLNNAREIAKELNLPLIAINHLEAHSLVVRLTSEVAFPFLLLLVSGGHTQLLQCDGVGDYTLLGTTLDDSLGEAFDKVARILKLPLEDGHAGEKLEHIARKGEVAVQFSEIMKGKPGLHFSYSGLKSQVMRYAKTVDITDEKVKANIAASFQYYAIKLIIQQTKKAIIQTRPSTLVVSGGVARNAYLKEGLADICARYSVNLMFPPAPLCTDNGAMVAWAAIERAQRGLVTEKGDDENETLECFAKLPLDQEMKIIDTSSAIFKKMKPLNIR